MMFVIAAKEEAKKGKGNEGNDGRYEEGKRKGTGKRQREEVDPASMAIPDHASF